MDKSVSKICIGCCETIENGGGLYSYELSKDGKLKEISKLSLDRPMYSVYDNKKMYTILREVFDKESAVIDVQISEGIFEKTGLKESTHGIIGCHLSVIEDDVYVANYMSGSIVKLPDTVVTHHGIGENKDRQQAPHTHCVIPSPCGKYVLCADLGLDRIDVYTRNLEPVSKAYVPKGHGARHIVFSPDGKYLYCINELTATVSVFSWNDGDLTLLDTVDSGVAQNIKPINTAGAIRVSNDGNKLYISNRGENSIVVFDIIDGKTLKISQKVSCCGKHPRDFILTENEQYLVCANMETNSVCVFEMNDGTIGKETDRIVLPKPICITNI